MKLNVKSCKRWKGYSYCMDTFIKRENLIRKVCRRLEKLKKLEDEYYNREIAELDWLDSKRRYTYPYCLLVSETVRIPHILVTRDFTTCEHELSIGARNYLTITIKIERDTSFVYNGKHIVFEASHGHNDGSIKTEVTCEDNPRDIRLALKYIHDWLVMQYQNYGITDIK